MLKYASQVTGLCPKLEQEKTLDMTQETMGCNKLQREKSAKACRDGWISGVVKEELGERQPNPTKTWKGVLRVFWGAEPCKGFT